MRRVLAADERPLHWVGSSKRDFPELAGGGQGGHGQRPRHRAVRRYRADGEALEGARSGRAGGRRIARRKRLSSGVHGSVREKPYVLHAFQKKSPSGIRTAKRDVDLVAERLKTAERDYEEHHGKQER